MNKPRTALERLLANARRDGACLLWAGGTTSGGYGTFYLDGRNQTAHRASFQLHKGPIPDDQVVMHTCDQRRCIEPSHLILGTRTENMQDMYAKRRDHHAAGSAHGLSKLTPEIADEIRRRYKPYDRKHGSTAMARKFGVTQSTVHCVIRGVTWRK